MDDKSISINIYLILKLVRESWGHAAFSGIAFYPQQCKKEWTDMPSKF